MQEASKTANAITQKEQRAEAFDNLTSALANTGDFGRAAQVVEEIPERWWRADALNKLVVALASAGKFDDAYVTAKRIPYNGWQSKALSELALELWHAGKMVRARIALTDSYAQAWLVPEDWERVENLCKLGRKTADLGQRTKAEKTLTKTYRLAIGLREQEGRDRALVHLVAVWAELGHLDKASDIQKQIVDSWSKADGYRALAKACIASGRLDRAGQYYEQAQDERSMIRRSKDWSSALTTLSKAMLEEGLLEPAQHVAGMIDEQRERAEAFRDLAERMARAKLLVQAQKVAESIAIPWYRAGARIAVAGTLAQAANHQAANRILQQARSDIRLVDNEIGRANILATLGKMFQHAGFRDRARRAFASALDAASFIPDENHKDDVLVNLIQAMGQCRMFGSASKTIGLISREESRGDALVKLVECLLHAKRMKQAQAAINTIQQTESRYRAQILLMETFAQSANLRRAEDTLQLVYSTIREIPNVWRQIQALCRCAISLAGLDAVDATKNTLQIAQEILGSISDDWLRGDALREIESAAAQSNLLEWMYASRDQARDTQSTMTQFEGLTAATSQMIGPLLEAMAARDDNHPDTAQAPPQGADKPRERDSDMSFGAALLISPKFESVRELAGSVLYGTWKKSTGMTAAKTYALGGQFSNAFAELDGLELDEYFAALNDWRPAFERFASADYSASSVFLNFLLRTLRIFAWVRVDWRNLLQHFR
jgi:tetratricopeptide (TPR) repeat protein